VAERAHPILSSTWGAIRAFVRFLFDYLDVLAAAGVVIWAAVQEAQGKLEGDRLTRTTAILVAIMAFALVRERTSRKSGFASVTDRLTRIETNAGKVVGDAESIRQAAESTRMAATETRGAVGEALAVLAGERPYHVLSAKFRWEMLTCDGAKAKATTTRNLRFTADNVFCIHEYSRASQGQTVPVECSELIDGERRTLPIMRDGFPGPQNRQYRIISLEGFRSRGERMVIESSRRLENAFTKRREDVKVEVGSGTDEVEIAVVWPLGCVLERIQIERTGSIAMREQIPVDQLDTLSDGRRELHHPVPQPVQGDKIFIIWDWHPKAEAGGGEATAE
jgi:hypothetical protein